MKNRDLFLLISHAKNRDQKSQTKLIDLFWMDVFSFVIKKTRDKDSADEITVNVFSKVLSKLDTFNSDFSFKTWLFAIAQNTVIDYWRKKNAQNPKTTGDFSEIEFLSSRSPEEIFISNEEQEKISEIIQNMNPIYRDIIELRFFEEKSIKEIAQELKLSTANTKVRIMRAKKILIKLLKEDNKETFE